MSRPQDLRASERIPVSSRIRVLATGRMAFYALAINISMGGVLLKASSELPVGSTCQVAIADPAGRDAREVLLSGTVIRTGTEGTAIRFASQMEQRMYEAFGQKGAAPQSRSAFQAYSDYFKACQSEGFQDAERLFGVTPRQFRNVYLTTLTTCIPLAILPVWLFQADIPIAPNWVKIAASFVYGGVWLLVVQPTVDLAALKVIRNRNEDVQA